MWIADNLSRGAHVDEIVARLRTEGVSETLAGSAVRSIRAKPRVLRGIGRDWGDLSAWSPSALAASHGAEIVEVTVDRHRDPTYSDTYRRKTRLMPLAELCAATRSLHTADLYLVSQSHALDRTSLRAHLDATLRVPPTIARSGPGTSSLWMGPAGSETVFHHDVMDLIALQLHGRKRWRTIAPTDRAWLHAMAGALDVPYTSRDPRVEDLRDVIVEEHVLDEGDAIVVPASTWHQVVAETASVTLSLTELVEPTAWFGA